MGAAQVTRARQPSCKFNGKSKRSILGGTRICNMYNALCSAENRINSILGACLKQYVPCTWMVTDRATLLEPCTTVQVYSPLSDCPMDFNSNVPFSKRYCLSLIGSSSPIRQKLSRISSRVQYRRVSKIGPSPR